MPSSERQDSNDYGSISPDPMLEAWCRGHILDLRSASRGCEAFKTLDQAWLQQSDPVWPVPVKRRIYRYMHSHSLYRMTGVRDPHVVELANSIIAAARLPTIPQVLEEVAVKCLSFLQLSAESWLSDGLIVPGKNNCLVKCPLLQKLWDRAVRKSPGRSFSIISTSQIFSASDDDKPNLCLESLNSTNAKCSTDKSAKKRPADRLEEPENEESSKRPRRNTSVEDDAEDCIIVSLPKTAERDNEVQSSKAKENYRISAPNATTNIVWIQTTLEAQAQAESHSSYPLHLDSQAHLNESSEKLGHDKERSMSGNSPKQNERLTPQSGNFPNVPLSSSSPSTVSSPPSRNSSDANIEANIGVQQHSSILSPVSPQNTRFPNSKFLGHYNKQVLPIDTNTVALDSANFTQSAHEIQPHHEISHNGRPPNPAVLSPCTLVSGENIDGRVETVNSKVIYNVTSSKLPDISQQAFRQRPMEIPRTDNSAFRVNTLSYTNLGAKPSTPLVDLAKARKKPSNIVTMGVKPRRQYGTPTSGQNLLTTSPTRRVPVEISNEHPPVSEIITSVTPGKYARTDETQIADQQPKAVAENHTPRAPPVLPAPLVSPNQTHCHSYGLPSVSQYLSPTSPPLPPPQLSLPTLPPLRSIASATSNIPSPRSFFDPAVREYQPPPVTFTDDDRTKSYLPDAQVKPLMAIFNKIARVSIRTSVLLKEPTSPTRLFPIGAIMWQKLSTFCKWYSQASSIPDHCLLTFELVDVTLRKEKRFIISENYADAYRLLKQYIWDMFFTELHFRGTLDAFTVSIEPSLPLPNTPQLHQEQSQVSSSADSNPVLAATDQALPPGYPNFLSNHCQPLGTQLPNSSRLTSARRTPIERIALRLIAYTLAARENARLFEDEWAGDGSTFCTEPLIGCGFVVDVRSGTGKVRVVGKDNLVLNSISTGPLSPGLPYMDIQIPDGYMCEVQGYAAIQLYSKLPAYPTPQSSPINEMILIKRDQDVSAPHSPNNLKVTTTIRASTPEILVRLQISPAGQFSLPYHKDVMHPKITTTKFLSWFLSQSNYCMQSRNSSLIDSSLHKPKRLRFTLKDAMPRPKATELVMGDEGYFVYMRKYIKDQFEKAKAFCPELREFVILITVPGWTDKANVEEEW